MTDKEYLLLHSYLYNNQNRLENELKEMQNNVRFRQIHSVDCVEMLYSQIRLETFVEVANDLRQLLKIAYEEKKK